LAPALQALVDEQATWGLEPPLREASSRSGSMRGMPATHKSHALDHVVLVLFENRSLDNVLGHLYGPEDGRASMGSSART
jgi:phospholipase C